MQAIGKDALLFKYRILYNGYPIVNEFSQGALPLPYPVDKYDVEKVYFDDNYGRFFTANVLKCHIHETILHITLHRNTENHPKTTI